MEEVIGLVAVGTGWVAILMPVFLIWVIFYFATKSDKNKYAAMVEISKNLEDPSDNDPNRNNPRPTKKIITPFLL